MQKISNMVSTLTVQNKWF